jgi:hypothetical protein
MAFKTSSSHQPSLFEDLTDDEDQGPIMCLMAKNMKVTSPNSSDDELDEEDKIASLIKQYGKSAATKMIRLIMKLDDLDETLESQEELFRLEREKSKALEGPKIIKFVKRGRTCDEGAKIIASSLKQDKFQASKTQESSSQMSFYADYILTRNHRGKVVAMFVGHRSWNTKVKSHVWLPKEFVTNTQGPKYCWVSKRKE